MSAVPKDPKTRRRRNITPGFKQLPHAGREGKAPPWPLTAHVLPERELLELAKWDALWSLPQAFEWERMRCYDDVALYVRTFIEASMPGASPEMLNQVRQLDLKIGVSPRAMQLLRWETDDAATEPEANGNGKVKAPATRAYIPKQGA